jgi:hypothetical protein
LEHDIQQLEARLEELRSAQVDPQILRDGQQIKAILNELAEAETKLAALLEHWEEAVELNG